jgi:hypothetical protein
LASVLAGLAVITAYVQLRPRAPVPSQEPGAPSPVSTPAVGPPRDAGTALTGAPVLSERSNQAEPPAEAGPAPSPEAEAKKPAPEPKLDTAAIAQVEAELDAASRDRARAEARAAEATRKLADAAGRAALAAAQGRKLAFLVRDPSTRIVQASSRGGFLRGERDKLSHEVTTLKQLPRPKLTSILGKSPVARPAYQDEYHFELRRNRVSFINLEKLMELTKADAQVRIRMSDRVPVITSRVGPVGSFSLAYELARAMPNSLEELIERKRIRFDLRAWEVIPESENRGEAYESTRNPISEFGRAVNRISPSRSTVTFWVYPDSFGLYRRLREDLIERGFSVAGRPLPEGMTIRGSPMGTQSAAQ